MTNGPVPDVTPTNQLFWDGTALGELRLRSCNPCGHRFRFISNWCPKCWSTDLSWIKCTGRGRVRAHTVVHIAPYESMSARTPYSIALVELEEGPTMMSNILDCDPATIKNGMSVEVIFEDRGDLRLPQFRPA